MDLLFPSQDHDMEPLLPQSNRGELEILAFDLVRESAQLGVRLNEHSRNAIGNLLRYVNSYYTNLIEGHATLPADIERVYRADYSIDPQKRSLQLEAKAHVEVERGMRARLRSNKAGQPNIFSKEFLQGLHTRFFRHMPEAYRTIKIPGKSDHVVIPGEFRSWDVEVGIHAPPTHASVEAFLERFFTFYGSPALSPAQRIIAIPAAHHRLLWIHPFPDGNGRVARLFTEACLIHMKLDSFGIWSVFRGLARSADPSYKQLLAAADDKRQGSTDGRGPLSDQSLSHFCRFFMETALDQIKFIEGLLEVPGLLGRVSDFAERGVSAGNLPKATGPLLEKLIIHGRLKRGDALRILSPVERTARNHLSKLLDLELVAADRLRHRADIVWRIPTTAGHAYFPNIYPATDREETPLLERGEPSMVSYLRSLSDDSLNRVLEEILVDSLHGIDNEESVSGAIAMTNASGFDVDDVQFEIDDIDLFDDDQARMDFRFHMTGEHDWESDKMYSGHEIAGSATLVIETDEHTFLENVKAYRVEYPDENEDVSLELDGEDRDETSGMGNDSRI